MTGDVISIEPATWTPLGNTGYEIRINLGWRRVAWHVRRIDDRDFVEVRCADGGPIMRTLVTSDRMEAAPSLLDRVMQQLGADVLDVQLRGFKIMSHP